jgi:cyclic pyranopterin phosphate synthase
MLDLKQRPLRDLRVSVTDRCNFRCSYCMPKEVFGPDFQFLPRAQILSFEEIARLVRIFVGEGVRKVRLTGGEPLLRAQLSRLVEMLTGITDLEEVTLTTNGSLLKTQARALKDAGLQRITVSLDSLDDATFRAMNDVDFPVSKVLEAVDEAERVGLAPVKLNAVVKRGVNDDGIVDLARYFKGSGHIVRFIEFMDVGATNGWRMEDVVSAAEIHDRIDAEFPLEPVEANYAGEVAERFCYKDGSGEIGIIASVTQPFCGACTRARLSAEGQLYTCLFATRGRDFRGLLRSGATDEELRERLRGIWGLRDDRYSELRTLLTPAEAARKVEMSHIGG